MALHGMGNPMYQVAADAMLADMVPPDDRSEAYAINRIASNTGFGMGPAIGGFLAATSYALALYGASIGFAVYAAIVILFLRETLPGRASWRAVATGSVPEGQPPSAAAQATAARRPSTVRGYRQVLGDGRFSAFALLFMVGMIAPSTVWVLLAVYTKTNYGLPEYLYGWIPTVNAVMCVVVQYPVTRLTARFRPLPVIAVGMAVYALGAGSVALMSSFPGFIVSMVVLTFGELIVSPTSTKYVADLAPASLRGRYMSIFWLGWTASRAIAPLVGGFLNDNVAPSAIWWGALSIGSMSVVGLGVLALRYRRVQGAAVAS
jgi:MFS family permease